MLFAPADAILFSHNVAHVWECLLMFLKRGMGFKLLVLSKKHYLNAAYISGVYYIIDNAMYALDPPTYCRLPVLSG